MKVRFCDIQWDTSGDDGTPTAASLGLPSGCVLEVADDLDVENAGADVLSDKYGYCVFGFDYEKLN